MTDLPCAAVVPRIALDVFVASADSDLGSRAGSPAAQGSKKYAGHRLSKRTGKMAPVLVEVSKAVKPWRKRVADEAWLAWRPRSLLACPIGIRCDFVLPRPIGTPKSKPTPPAVKKHHDGDKLDRAIWDALTKVVYADDSLIVEWSGTKRIAEVGERPGCRIRVWCVEGGGHG